VLAIAQAAREVVDDPMLEPLIAEVRAQGVIDLPRDGAGIALPRVDRPRVRVGTLVRFFAAQDPLRRRVESVEIDVREDRVDGAGLADDLGRDHLGAGPVLGLRRQAKARIAGEVRLALVIVVVHPRRQARAEVPDEREGDLLEGRSHPIGGEGDVEHGDAPGELLGVGQRARRREAHLRPRSLRARHRGQCKSKP
jgi:hypothetical protein